MGALGFPDGTASTSTSTSGGAEGLAWGTGLLFVMLLKKEGLLVASGVGLLAALPPKKEGLLLALASAYPALSFSGTA